MSLMGDDLYDLYEEEPFRIEEQDLRILKAITTDGVITREFCASYDHNLFVGDAKAFAQKVISYYKGYSALPTRRVMLEISESNPILQSEINFVWDKLDGMEHNSSEFKWDLDKIKNRHTKQKLTSIREGIVNLDLIKDENLEDHLNSIRANLDSAEKIRKGKESSYIQKTLKEYMPEFREDFIRKSKDPDLGKGLMTGFSYLDYVTNGLSPADMLIVAGETGAGKSILLNNMAIQMWLQGIDLSNPNAKGVNVQYFSLEMPYDQCVRRTMARLSGIPTYGLRDCQITDPNQLEALSNAAKFINKFNAQFEIVDIPRGITIKTIEERYLEAVARGRAPEVVVIDYLGLMEANDINGEDWFKLGHISGQLHEFSRTYNVVVLSAVQLNRPKTNKPNDVIGLHRIGRSALIMTHATVGIQIETRPDESTYPDMIYHIIKNRNGEQGNHILKKDFRRGTVIDMKPYQPLEDDGIGNFSSVTPPMEDISSYLDGFGWNK